MSPRIRRKSAKAAEAEATEREGTGRAAAGYFSAPERSGDGNTSKYSNSNRQSSSPPPAPTCTSLTAHQYKYYYHNMIVPVLPAFAPHSHTPNNNSQNKPGSKHHPARVSLGQFVHECDIRRKQKLLDKYSYSYTPSNRVYKKDRPWDIVFARGTRHSFRPGNWFFRQIVAINKTFYMQTPREEKAAIAAMLMEAFRNLLGTRFFGLHEQLVDHRTDEPTYTYMELPYDRVLEKFMQGLREKSSNNVLILPKLMKEMPWASVDSDIGNDSSTNTSLRKNSAKAHRNPKTTVTSVKAIKRATKMSETSHKPHHSTGAVASIPRTTLTTATTTATSSMMRTTCTPAKAAPAGNPVAVGTALATPGLAAGVTTEKGINFPLLNKYLKSKGTSVATLMNSCNLAKKDNVHEGYSVFASEMERREHELTDLRTNITDLECMDVIFGQGPQVVRRIGNTLFRFVVGANQRYYFDAEKTEKGMYASALIGFFVQAGARFLQINRRKDHSGVTTYSEVNFDRVSEKFKQGLRERCLTRYARNGLLDEIAQLSIVATKNSTTCTPLPTIHTQTTSTAVSVVTPNAKRLSSFLPKKVPSATPNSRSIMGRKRPFTNMWETPDDDDDDGTDYEESTSVHAIRREAKPGSAPAPASFSTTTTTTPPLSKRALKKLRIQKYLSIGHFSVDFEEDKKRKSNEIEDGATALLAIRFALKQAVAPPRRRNAITSDTRASMDGRSSVAAVPSPEEPTERLAELYRPSPLRRFRTNVQAPLPFFHPGA